MHELVDGEVIIIQLEAGTYFSLRGCAPEIWALLATGRDEAGVVEALRIRYRGRDAEIERAVKTLLGRLVAERVIEADPESPVPPLPASLGDPASYEEPVLERYDDMQDFLLVDPIHEVGAAGWPAPPPAA